MRTRARSLFVLSIATFLAFAVLAILPTDGFALTTEQAEGVPDPVLLLRSQGTAKSGVAEASSAKEANKLLKEYAYGDLYLTMKADWVGETITIPKSTTVTINMNGHKINRNLRGKSVVRDNKGGNFILAEGNRINVNLTRKSEVHVDDARNPNAFVRVTPDNEQSPNCTQYLKSDAVYHFTYNNRKEQRQRVRAGAHCAARLRRRGRVGERLCAGRYGRRGGGRLCRGG